MKLILVLLAITLCMAQPVRAQALTTIDVDSNGMGRALIDWPAELPIRAGIWVVRDNWKSVKQQWDLKDHTYSPFDVKRSIDATFDIDGKSLAMSERIDAKSISYTLTAKQRIDLTGVYWFFEVPIDRFAGGRVVAGERLIALPTDKPAAASLGQVKISMIHVVSADRKTQVALKFPADREIRVQDARVFGEDRYQIYTPLIEGELAEGSKLTLDVMIDTQLPIDTSAATITIDPSKPLNAFDGFGGNFVYAIDDPTTQFALDNLRLTWARIGIEAAKWEPTNDNDDPRVTDEAALAARDVDGSALRKRFELDQKLFKLSGGRLIASLWYPPEWLFDKPLPERNVPGTIARAKWEELAECITSYLLHLKKRYHVEPALFSFNESDIGIYVLLDGDEMRDMIKLLGQRFADAGLRTKILLGDSADLEKGLTQIAPTLADAEAMKFVGGLAYHPWSGQNERWGDWADLAKKHSLPLMATEMGADPSAWKDGSFNSPLATLRLARRYIEQLRDARTQAMLEWEWTGDYAMTTRGPATSKKNELLLTSRGLFLKHISRTTPTQSVVIATNCTSDSIIAAAVAAKDMRPIVVYIINRGGDRRVTIRGMPIERSRGELQAYEPNQGALTSRRVGIEGGACDIEIPAGSIATLVFPLID